MDDSPLNGVTEMTFGSDTKGMLLESPPSKHHCRGKQFKYLYRSPKCPQKGKYKKS